jgi:hypothetical protein
MQVAYRLFQLESRMAAQLGLQRPASVISRIDGLFRDDYARAVNALGLDRTGKTLCMLLDLNLTESMKTMDPSELPRHFAYDPSALSGKGAVIQI